MKTIKSLMLLMLVTAFTISCTDDSSAKAEQLHQLNYQENDEGGHSTGEPVIGEDPDPA